MSAALHHEISRLKKLVAVKQSEGEQFLKERDNWKQDCTTCKEMIVQIGNFVHEELPKLLQDGLNSIPIENLHGEELLEDEGSKEFIKWIVESFEEYMSKKIKK